MLDNVAVNVAFVVSRFDLVAWNGEVREFTETVRAVFFSLLKPCLERTCLELCAVAGVMYCCAAVHCQHLSKVYLGSRASRIILQKQTKIHCIETALL